MYVRDREEDEQVEETKTGKKSGDRRMPKAVRNN